MKTYNPHNKIQVSESLEDVSYLDEKDGKVFSRSLNRLTAASFLLIICCGALYYAVDWPSKDIFTSPEISLNNEIKPIRKSSTFQSFSPDCLDHIPLPDNRIHIVPPPAGPVTLVCCNSTKGILNIEVHPTWAPIGAERFLHMVNSGFFSTKIGLFRALKGFLVQFGLAGL